MSDNLPLRDKAGAALRPGKILPLGTPQSAEILQHNIRTRRGKPINLLESRVSGPRATIADLLYMPRTCECQVKKHVSQGNGPESFKVSPPRKMGKQKQAEARKSEDSEPV